MKDSKSITANEERDEGRGTRDKDSLFDIFACCQQAMLTNNSPLSPVPCPLSQKIHEYAIISTTSLHFDKRLLDYCKTNACGNYNKSWTCPPACGTLEEQREKIRIFKEALVFTTKHEIEDSFDYDGMNRGRERHTLLMLEVRDKLAKEKGDALTAPIFVYGAGACPICKETGGCAFPEPCRFPEKRIGSIEAAGIDVTELSKACGIAYNNGANTVTFFSMVLFSDNRI